MERKSRSKKGPKIVAQTVASTLDDEKRRPFPDIWFFVQLGVFLLLMYKLYFGVFHVPIKSVDEIGKARKAANLASRLLQHLTPLVQANATTNVLDGAAVAFAKAHGVTNAPLLYGGMCPFELPAPVCQGWNTLWWSVLQVFGLVISSAKAAPMPLCGFPKSLCVSVNDVVCHGIPGGTVLREGDLVNVDVTVILDGYHGDSSIMILVGGPPLDELSLSLADAEGLADLAQIELGRVSRECLFAGLREVRAGGFLGDVGAAVEARAEEAGYSVVLAFGGHGIGIRFHEAPHVAHVGERGKGLKLEAGMIFTIEPMINTGAADVYVEPDMWTVRTVDGSLSAQWEHMVLVLEDGCEVLTWREGELSPARFPMKSRHVYTALE